MLGQALRAVGLHAPAVSILDYFSLDARGKRLHARSLAMFKRKVDVYWSGIVPDPSATDRKDLYEKVAADGFALVPDYLHGEALESVRREVFALPGLLDGKYQGPLPFTNKPSDGICAFGVTQDLPATYRWTVGNTELHGVARSLFGPTIKLTASSVLSKYNKDTIDSSEAPHWDDWRVRFKSFIYLTDVTEANAPTIYVKGSVASVPWRLDRDYASVYAPVASAGGSWWPVEALGLEKVVCTGKAGTMLLFDARGIHAGTRLTGSPRVMLMNMYTTHLGFQHRVY
jgi:hypothetical protein